MAFQTPKTVEEVLQAIHRKDFLMPAIQREFVWGTEQIVKLVDSLMRGYPVGSFLFWEVTPATAQDYTFYDFLTHFHERDSPHASKATVPAGHGTVAILDGQQRLTSLNVAIYGSHAEKKKYAWWNSPGAFPTKRLYLNLAEGPPNEELGLKYDLRFLTDEEAKPRQGEPDKWFRVGAILQLENSLPALNAELNKRHLPDLDSATQRLWDLYVAVRQARPMNYFLVTDQDPNKVLEIFVRVNSGGTQLSYSDLLLSMATNQWKELDAREEVRSLVQELNTGGSREFGFSKDLVLKTALMIAGVDLRFRVSNFTRENMAKVESVWLDVEKALLRSADLLRQFGYSTSTLTADSVLIPIAYYLDRRGVGDSYLASTADASDRATIQRWTARSLIKRGIWGSGLDTTLGRIRNALDKDGLTGFPVEAVEKEMASVGKGLTFDETEIDELLAAEYGKKRTFSILSLLYPGLDLSKQFHQDHVFPKSHFTPKRLVAAGVPHDKIDDYRQRYNVLPNLQLLAGPANVEKQSAMPTDWMKKHLPEPAKYHAYVADNDLGGLDLGIHGFVEFFESRKQRMRERLQTVLGIQQQAVVTAARGLVPAAPRADLDAPENPLAT